CARPMRAAAPPPDHQSAPRTDCPHSGQSGCGYSHRYRLRSSSNPNDGMNGFRTTSGSKRPDQARDPERPLGPFTAFAAQKWWFRVITGQGDFATVSLQYLTFVIISHKTGGDMISPRDTMSGLAK